MSGAAQPAPLVRSDLDAAACEGCGGAHRPGSGHDASLYFRGRCHFNAATWARYDKTSGVLTIECAACEKMIARLQVAEELP